MNTTTLKSHTQPPRTPNCQLHTIGPTMDLANPQFRAPTHSFKKLVTCVCVSGYLCYVNCHQPLTEPNLSKKPGMMISSLPPQHSNLTLNPHAHQIANYTQLDQPWTWQTPNFAHQRTH